MGNRIFFDTEFLEDGKTIELISIGLVKENGESYYAETTLAIELAASTPWLIENVLHSLVGTDLKDKAQISEEIVEFVGAEPEFWAYYANYDWVVLCQLYGRMFDLPPGWPMYCRDFKQYIDERGLHAGKQEEGTEHNALNDAQWLRDEFVWMKDW